MARRDHRRRDVGAGARAVEALERRQLLSASGIVTGYPGPPTDPPVPAPHPSQHADSLVAGRDGNLWFTDQGNNAVGRQTPGGAMTEFALPTADAGPDDIVAGPDGNLWFVEPYSARIGRVTPAGAVTEFALPSADAVPSAIAAGGGGGGLWFIDTGTNSVGRITTGGKVSEIPLDISASSLAGGIVVGADGNAWVSTMDDSGNAQLLRVTPAGKTSSFALPEAAGTLAFGPDGNLWAGAGGEIDRISTSGVVSRFSLPNDFDTPFNIVAGPDGAMWFTTYGLNPLGRITTDGAVIEFVAPGLARYDFVSALTSGPGGELWYATDTGGAPAPVTAFDPTGALLAGGFDGSATAGSTDSVVVASFADLAGGADASFFRATLAWDDGSTTDGTIAPNATGGFEVSASRAWGMGSAEATVTITDVRPAASDGGHLAGRTAMAYASVYSAAPPTVGTAVAVNATAGQLFTGVVARYTGVLLNSLSSYTANIDWGDGHYTRGTIAPDAQGGVTISGSNRYAHSGSYAVTTNLWPWAMGVVGIGGGGVSGGGIGIVPRGKVVGVAAGAASAGSTSGGSGAGGVIALPPIQPAPPEPGGPLPPVPVPDPGPVPDPIPDPVADGTTGTATVGPGVMDGSGFTVLASSKDSADYVVAQFTLADAGADLSHFHATVKWNDGGTFDWFTQPVPDVADAPIAPDGQGGFTLSVNAQLPQYGWYHFQVLVSDDRLGAGDAAIVGAAYGQVVVDTPIRPIPVDAGVVTNASGATRVSSGAGATAPAAAVPDPALGEHVKFSAVRIRRRANAAFKGDVGVLTGVVAGRNAGAALSGTIDWGDGTTSVAQFVAGRKGKIHVRGVHTYSAAGDHAVKVMVTQSLSGGGSSGANAPPPIHLPVAHATAHIARGSAAGGHHGKGFRGRDGLSGSGSLQV